MTREEFLSLPQTIQLRMLVDALDEGSSRRLLNQEKPKIPFSPKYDLAIYRSGGNMWASETALEGLIYWRGKYKAGADGGGQYAAQDAKRVTNIDKWIAWRECFPSDCWGGMRGDEEVVAKPPSTKPTVYPRQGGQRRQSNSSQQQHDDVDPDNFNF